MDFEIMRSNEVYWIQTNPTIKEEAYNRVKILQSALKLQELVKDRLEHNKSITDKATDMDWARDSNLGKLDKENILLQSLIEESEK